MDSTPPAPLPIAAPDGTLSGPLEAEAARTRVLLVGIGYGPDLAARAITTEPAS